MGTCCKSLSVSLLVAHILIQSSECFLHHSHRRRASNNCILTNSQPQCMFMIKESDKFGSIDDYDDDSDDLSPIDLLGPEVITDPDEGDDEYGDAEEDWVPDIEIAKRISDRKLARAEDLIGQAEDNDEVYSPPKSTATSSSVSTTSSSLATDEDGTTELDDADYFAGPNINTPPPSLQKSKRQIYSEEEEDLINSMGGNSMDSPSPKREAGFLGDSTLREISRDFQVPICYLADVLCTWGVPVPINVDERLGDMVTGEMAFAMAEAVHSMDVGEIYDAYSSFDLAGLCFEYDIELKDAFDFVIKEGWNLPFGVKTHLRTDQEDKLLQTLSDDLVY